MKVSSKELFSVVRELVREELRKQAPAIIRECLSESYIKRIVQESAGEDRPAPVKRAGKMSLAEQLDPQDEPEEEIVSVPPPRRVANPQLLERKNPLDFIYHDVKPIPSEGAQPSLSDVPVKALGLDPERMRALSGAPQVSHTDSAAADSAYERKMRELEERRKALDVPVVVSR